MNNLINEIHLNNGQLIFFGPREMTPAGLPADEAHLFLLKVTEISRWLIDILNPGHLNQNTDSVVFQLRPCQIPSQLKIVSRLSLHGFGERFWLLTQLSNITRSYATTQFRSARKCSLRSQVQQQRSCMAAMLHGRNNRFFFLWEKCSFLCKIFSLFLPCNMATVQNLYYKSIFFKFYISSHKNTCIHSNMPGSTSNCYSTKIPNNRLTLISTYYICTHWFKIVITKGVAIFKQAHQLQIVLHVLCICL